jgi:rhamnose utilization protein RhaD (predicted bifunctional aldolase and dehydrogenase)/NAD(P)-dependent dehydrogenase (short-subunit alcohol dehydrogenase family)
MNSLWNDADAAQYPGDLGQRVYTSRLLGSNPALVVHGGGNTSVKVIEQNLFGEDEPILYIKGSGGDLGTIDASGFAPVRLNAVLRLAQLETLSDPQMANELHTSLFRANAPGPSVETILHALLPYKFVDHTHADAVISIMNAPNGTKLLREVYGEDVLVVPYAMPGFKLARAVAQALEAHSLDGKIAVILMHHGVFTFGATAREAYERMIEVADRAEQFLKARNAWEITPVPVTASATPQREQIAELRQAVSAVAGGPMVLMQSSNPLGLHFANLPDVDTLSQQGPATPDHVIRTKRLPLVGRDVAAYSDAYRQYFQAYQGRAAQPLTMLDAAPRIILDPELGLLAAGHTPREAAIASDIYSHIIEIILRAQAIGGWTALSAEDFFDMEYWDLEQAKLRKEKQRPSLAGQIALVTGAASGIGKACAESLLARGAAVVGVDLNPAIETQYKRREWLGVVADLTDEDAITAALEAAVRRFGGLDILVLNAGIFPKSTPTKDLATADWQRVIDINLTANMVLLREAHPLLKRAPAGGKVAIIGSKNVPAPGPGVASYSASKAALNQLARVIALEWGKDGIRVNSVHPNAVFDTALWNDELLALRAQHYGMTVDQYKRNNIMGVEITSHDVAEMVAAMCEPLFAKTTGAQIPIDGGNERVI